MSIMDNLKELMDMSAVQEEDNPVFISRTGEFNLFSPKHKIRKNRKYGDTGVAYSEDGKTLEECPAIRPGRIRIHEGVERIGVNAFRNGRLSAIIMPDSIIELEYGAFMCSDVHDVKFGKNIRKIGDECFSSCSNISEITFPDSLEEIGELAFSPCINLRNITFSKNLKVIGRGAFGSTSLKEVTIPSGSISIGNQAFCSAEHVIISDSIPKNFIFSIVLEDDGYYNEERVLSDDYVKVTYKGNTAVLPRVIKRGELKKLNRDFESIIMGPNRKRLFLKAAHACEKQAAALAEYRLSRTGIFTCLSFRDSVVCPNVLYPPSIIIYPPIPMRLSSTATSLQEWYSTNTSFALYFSRVPISTSSSPTTKTSSSISVFRNPFLQST